MYIEAVRNFFRLTHTRVFFVTPLDDRAKNARIAAQAASESLLNKRAYCRFVPFTRSKGSSRPLPLSSPLSRSPINPPFLLRRPYSRFNGVDWFLQNAPTVNCPAPTVSVSIRTSSATTISTAMTPVTSKIAVRISLDKYISAALMQFATFNIHQMSYYTGHSIS